MATNQNTLTMPDSIITKSLTVNPALTAELEYCAKETGVSLTKLAEDAINWYIQCCTPDLIQSAQKRQRVAAGETWLLPQVIQPDSPQEDMVGTRVRDRR